MSGRAGGGQRVRAVAALLVAAAVLLAGIGLAACGDSRAPLDALAGTWLRIDGGQPAADLVLTVAGSGDAGARVTFVDKATGDSLSATARLEDDVLQATLPSADGSALAVPGVSGELTVRLSIDEGTGELVVDRVLADGTSEPLWLYERAAETSPGS